MSAVAIAAERRHSSLAWAGPTYARLYGENLECYATPPHGWTCFHCGETFTNQYAAGAHFGPGDLMVKPRCLRRAQLRAAIGLIP
jgi:hypothetical protein